MSEKTRRAIEAREKASRKAPDTEKLPRRSTARQLAREEKAAEGKD